MLLTPSDRTMYSLLMHGSRNLTALVIGALMLLPAASARAQAVGTALFASGLTSPTYVTAPAGDFTRLFVTELSGQIEILDATTGAQRAAPFLTILGVDGEGLLAEDSLACFQAQNAVVPVHGVGRGDVDGVYL